MRNLMRFVGMGIGVVGVTMLVAHAAQPALNVKLGLWETQVNPQISGDLATSIPDEQLQKMTPEQRAKMQQAMQAMQASMAQPHLAKDCMTAEKLAKGFNFGTEESPQCRTTIVTNSGSEFESHQECAENGGSRSTSIHIIAKSSDHITGEIRSNTTKGGKVMAFNATMEGRWLGSDCGAIKDYQAEKLPGR